MFEEDWSAVERTADGSIFVSVSSADMESLPRSIAMPNLASLIKVVGKYESDILGLTLTNRSMRLETDQWKHTLPVSGGMSSVRALHEAKVFGGLDEWHPVETALLSELRQAVEGIVEGNPSRDRKVGGKQIPGTRVVVPLGDWSYVPLTYEPKTTVDFASSVLTWSYETGDMPDLPPHLEPRWEKATGPRVFGGGGSQKLEADVPELQTEVQLPLDVLPDVCRTVERTAEGGAVEVCVLSDVLAFRTRGTIYAMPTRDLRAELQ